MEAVGRRQERERPIVALLEARMSSELARLVERYGGTPLSAPAVREVAARPTLEVRSLIAELEAGCHDVVTFMTGVAVLLLFELAEQVGTRAELVASLRRTSTVCRGPKPTAALRGFGVPPTLTAREPFTAAELIDALADLEVAGKRVLLFNYGERCETLAETLIARRAQVQELWLYRWQLPEDLSALEGVVRSIVEREVDALAITCQVQFRHLLRVAQDIGLEHELLRALDEDLVVGAVGPTCRAVLETHGIEPDVVPEHPKMGPLIVAMMRHLDQHGGGGARRESPTERSKAALQ